VSAEIRTSVSVSLSSGCHLAPTQAPPYHCGSVQSRLVLSTLLLHSVITGGNVLNNLYAGSKIYIYNDHMHHGSSVGVMTRLRATRLRNRGSIPNRGKNFVSSPKRPDRLWCPPSLLFNVYRGGGDISLGVHGQGMNLTTHTISCRV
jgi:hypothetical protein